MTIIRSPFPDVEIPDVALTPFVFARAEELGDKPALVDGPSGRTLSHAGLLAAIRRFAGGLQERGFAKGDCVALFMPNLPEYAVAFHGTAWAGGMVTTINPVYGVEEVEFQLRDSAARFVVTVEQSLHTAQAAAAKVDGVEHVFVVGEDMPDGEPLAEQVRVDPRRDLVALPYSSGTTGLPKGVMLTHRNLVANLLQAGRVQQPQEDDVLVGVLPFFHIYGMTVIMNLGLQAGATIVTMPRFDLEAFLRNIQEHGVTRAYVVPPIALALARHPAVDQFDTSSLRFVMSGAAPLGPELEDECKQRLECRVTQGYGMTETSPVTHTIPFDGDPRPGSIGPALPSTECRIVVLEEDRDAEPGERGELWIRGPQVMAGYLNNDEATRATIDGDGWLHTGDVAVVDEDGWFAIVDRVKELIKYKGFQVAPAELEALLVTHPAVADAAVIPVPDEEAGEIPKAFVVLRGEATEDEIMEFVAEHVATYKRVRAVEIVDEIPKSPSGKILRRVLRERESARAS